MPALFTPNQNVPPFERLPGTPESERPKLFGKTWWLYFNNITTLVNKLGAALTVGAIPKVTADGTFGESALTDDGTKVSSTERVEIDIGAAPQNSQVKLAANAAGALQLLCYSPDNGIILYDLDWQGGAAFIARDTSVARAGKGGDKYEIWGAGGQTPGSALSGEAPYFSIDLATGVISFPAYTTNGFLKTGGGTGLLSAAALLPSELPSYVAVNLTGQTAAIGATNIRPGGVLAPAGLYAIDGYFWISTAGTGGTITLTISWNNGSATHSPTIPQSANSLAGVTPIGYRLYTSGASDVTYAVSFAGVTGSPQFGLKFAMTRIGN